ARMVQGLFVRLDNPWLLYHFSRRPLAVRLVRLCRRATGASAAGRGGAIRRRDDARHARELAVRIPAIALAGGRTCAPALCRITAVERRRRPAGGEARCDLEEGGRRRCR